MMKELSGREAEMLAKAVAAGSGLSQSTARQWIAKLYSKPSKGLQERINTVNRKIIENIAMPKNRELYEKAYFDIINESAMDSEPGGFNVGDAAITLDQSSMFADDEGFTREEMLVSVKIVDKMTKEEWLNNKNAFPDNRDIDALAKDGFVYIVEDMATKKLFPEPIDNLFHTKEEAEKALDEFLAKRG